MSAQFRLIDRSWASEFERVVKRCHRSVRIVCPFITQKAAADLVRWNSRLDLRIITRFNLEDWSHGVSSADALRFLLERGSRIRGVQDLHAKLFIFDEEIVILGSTNLTHAALNTNHELGVVIESHEITRRCAQYFEEIWREARPTLTGPQLDKYEREFIERSTAEGRHPRKPRYPDYGRKISRVSAVPAPVIERIGGDGAFVKFFGSATSRYTLDQKIESEVLRSGCHWACGYSRTPRNVTHGSVVFMARLMTHDTRIFGRAIAIPYRPTLDKPTKEDTERRAWKARWPYQVRVLRPELLAGTFANAVSLFELMDDLGADTFVTTQRNKERGFGNIDPRASLRRQPAMMLTELAYKVLSERLDAAFHRHGRLNLATIHDLDWPEHVDRLSDDGRRLLSLIRQQLASETIDIERPGTFPKYKDVVRSFGLVPAKGRNIVRQVRAQCGLDNLDNWTRRYDLPAITGFVVTDSDRLIAPGELFFNLRTRNRKSDVQWWHSELRKAAAYDWERVLE